MRKHIALALGMLGLGGCAQANRAGELFLNPPLTVLENLQAVLLWLANLLGGFFVSLASSLFN